MSARKPMPEAGGSEAAVTTSILDAIVASKRLEVTRRQAELTLAQMRLAAQQAPAPRDFVAALRARIDAGHNALIAEFKRASPSRGVIRDGVDPADVAQAYERGGAACMSVLTDEPWFGARATDLKAARAACSLPVLRKDFIVDAYQVHESRAMGADCVLLIAACLGDQQLQALASLANELGMAVIVEVHGQPELERALQLDTPLIGVNSRDLHSFDVSLQGVIDLQAAAPADRLLIAESGITGPHDVRLLRQAGIRAFLVGEALMRAADPGVALGELVHTAGGVTD